MSERYDVAIVGGGLTGLALAWELSKLGIRRVVILERGYTGSGASGRNVGRIRAMQLEPRLTQLALAAQEKHARLGDELGMNTLFWRAGYAWVLYDPIEVERMSALRPMLRSFGVETSLCDANATLDRLPILRGGERPAGALIRPRDAIVHHDALIYGFRRRILDAGVTLRETHEVVDIEVQAGRVAGVAVRSAGRDIAISTDTVVNAAEGWSPEISALVDLSVPNRPVRHEVLVTEPTRPFMQEAITFYRPMEGWFNQTLRGEMVAGVSDPDEPVGLNHSSTFAFLKRTASTLVAKAPRLGHLRVIRQWAGVYDMTPDRLPIVGPAGTVAGLYQANGYSGRGFALAPVLAEKLARTIARGEQHEFLRWCDPGRFESATDWDLRGDYYSGYQYAATSAGGEGGASG